MKTIKTFQRRYQVVDTDLNLYPTEHKFREAPITGTSPCLVKAVLHRSEDRRLDFHKSRAE
jgi:hypothetical protein